MRWHQRLARLERQLPPPAPPSPEEVLRRRRWLDLLQRWQDLLEQTLSGIDNDLGAMLCQSVCDGFTDAFGRAGDDGGFAVQIEQFHGDMPTFPQPASESFRRRKLRQAEVFAVKPARLARLMRVAAK